jgi:hypothetical protein
MLPRRVGHHVRTKGSPLVMLGLLLAGWCGVRVMWWEYPFAPAAQAYTTQPQPARSEGPPAWAEFAPFARYVPLPETPFAWVAPSSAFMHGAGAGLWRPATAPVTTRYAGARGAAVPAPATIWLPGALAGFSLPPGERRGAAALSPDERAPSPPPPFLPPSLAAAAPPGRWSLDGWAFWRQGSDAAPVSQGRVPVYGASQSGTILQYRLAPASRYDPRLYLRAYRALVVNGENEFALGTSLRPLAAVPLRVAGEVRYTDAAFGTAVRPAGYVVTELPPVRLPYGTQLEAYGQGGWVGGPASTWFADGQASVTGPIRLVDRLSRNALNLSLGAAVWGGAQKDAERLDIGPTLRLDMKLGKMPTRVTVDWRQRVAGDASPDSGVAATLSTQF